MMTLEKTDEKLTEDELRAALVEYRDSMRMSQEYFAKRYGFKAGATVSFWETGATRMPLEVAIDVFDWLLKRSTRAAYDKGFKTAMRKRKLEL